MGPVSQEQAAGARGPGGTRDEARRTRRGGERCRGRIERCADPAAAARDETGCVSAIGMSRAHVMDPAAGMSSGPRALHPSPEKRIPGTAMAPGIHPE